MVQMLGKEKDIDLSYYNKLVDDAKDTISDYGDFEWFVSDDPYIPNDNNLPLSEPIDLPWD